MSDDGARFRQLHVVGCSPRAGTTLVHEVLVTCFRVDRHYDHEIRLERSTAEEGEVLVTKRPKDTFYVSRVLDVPGFHALYVLRDPRDVVVSRHAKDRSKYYSNFRLWQELHDAARAFREHPKALWIRYEDFVRDPDRVQADVARRFPWLETRHAFSEYHEHAEVSELSQRAMNGVRPISAKSVGAWRQHLPRIAGQARLHGSFTPALVECGYEPDAAWERVLEGVEPDLAPSLYPEHPAGWRRLAHRLDAARKGLRFRSRRRAGR